MATYKSYKDNGTITAVFYDGSTATTNEVVKFCRLRKSNELRTRIGNNNKLYVINRFMGQDYFIPVKPNSYVIRYASGRYFPLSKAAFEKRFTEVKDEPIPSLAEVTIDISNNICYISQIQGSGCKYQCRNKQDLKEAISNYIDEYIIDE